MFLEARRQAISHREKSATGALPNIIAIFFLLLFLPPTGRAHVALCEIDQDGTSTELEILLKCTVLLGL